MKKLTLPPELVALVGSLLDGEVDRLRRSVRMKEELPDLGRTPRQLGAMRAARSRERMRKEEVERLRAIWRAESSDKELQAARKRGE